jgi:hypothetical protein
MVPVPMRQAINPNAHDEFSDRSWHHDDIFRRIHVKSRFPNDRVFLELSRDNVMVLHETGLEQTLADLKVTSRDATVSHVSVIICRGVFHAPPLS